MVHKRTFSGIDAKTQSFYCESCEYGTDKERNFAKHLETKFHIERCDYNEIHLTKRRRTRTHVNYNEEENSLELDNALLKEKNARLRNKNEILKKKLVNTACVLSNKNQLYTSMREAKAIQCAELDAATEKIRILEANNVFLKTLYTDLYEDKEALSLQLDATIERARKLEIRNSLLNSLHEDVCEEKESFSSELGTALEEINVLETKNILLKEKKSELQDKCDILQKKLKEHESIRRNYSCLTSGLHEEIRKLRKNIRKL